MKKHFLTIKSISHNFKEKHPVFSLLLTTVLLSGLAFLCEFILEQIYQRFNAADPNFNLIRLFFITIIVEFIGITIYFGKKGGEFVYKKRYLFGAIFFIICVAFQINYSCSPVLDDMVQPNNSVTEGETLTGKRRSIRSDEFVTETSALFSQYYNDYQLVNPDLMGGDVVTSFYPKYPNRTFFSVATTPQFLGFMILPFENAFSFYQLLPWFVAFFAVFEMLMILTNKRRVMSLIGSLFIIFSPVVLWFNSVQYLMYAALLFDIVYLFINHATTWKTRLGISILLGWVLACFVMNIYPAWQIPYAYVAAFMILGLFIQYRKKLKWKYLLYLVPVVCLVVILVLPNLLMSLEQYKLTTGTVYPGQRFEAGGGGLSQAFIYVSSIFFPILPHANPCEASGYIGLFPLPIILGVIYILKNTKAKKHDPILITLTILALFYTFMFLIGNSFIARITLLFLTPASRLRPALDLVCILILARIIGKYETKSTPRHAFVYILVSLLFSAAITLLGQIYQTPLQICATLTLFFLVTYCVIVNRKYTNIFLGATVFLYSAFNLMTIMPINIGLDAYLDKPVSQEIRKLSSENEDAKWMSNSDVLANFAVANDAKVINSVNLYPNFKNWNQLDSDGQYRDIYNRFAHIAINISDEKTHFVSPQPDFFSLYLNYQDVCLLKPSYYISSIKLPNEYNQFTLQYEEDGVYIYKISCQ